jgi:hypothetical protein
MKGLMPPKKKNSKPLPDMDSEDNNLDDSRPSETPSSGAVESVGSKKSGSGWRRVVDKFKKGYTNKNKSQTNTGTTAAKTSSQGEETKKDEEELNVQLVTDIDDQVQQDYFNQNTKESQMDSHSEEEHEDVQSFVAETDGGSKSKKSSGDSKGSRTVASKISSKEERKLSLPP